ncbi:hypothetical protein DRQ05_05450 [bacterium]|nr:MAG: hypothetical protein DRQ05_05450 [bacterium]
MPLSGRALTGLLAALVFVAVGSEPAAGFDDGGGTVSPFMLGAGSKSIAMGGASVAYWRDSYAVLWNPAGLYYIDKGEVNLFHTSFFDQSTAYSSVIVSYPFIDFGVISASAIQLSVGGIERRDEANIVIPGELSNRQTRYIISYANKIISGLSAGVSLKMDRYAQGEYLANGFGVDAGLGLRTSVHSSVVDEMIFGFSVENLVEPKINIVSEEVGDPSGIRAGMAVVKSISSKLDDRLAVAFDIDKFKLTDPHLHLGVEYALKGIFSVRGGWNGGVPTFGCGFSLRYFDVDYAYRSTDLGANHLFSFVYRFGSSRKEKIDAREKRKEALLARELEAKMSSYEKSFIKSSMGKARKSLEKGEYDRAAGYFRSVLMWSPDNVEAKEGLKTAEASLLVIKGDSLMKTGKYPDALFAYREAETKMKSPGISKRIVECERKLSESTDRKRITEEIFTHALDLYSEKKWDEALKGFDKVLEMDHSNELAAQYREKTLKRIEEEHGRLAADIKQLVSKNRFTQALELLRNRAERNPSDTTVARLMKYVSAEKAAFKQTESSKKPSVRQKKQLSESEKESLRANYEKGIEYFKGGSFSEAIKIWEPIWRSYPSFERVSEYLIKAYQYLGMEFYTQHKYDQALKTWRNILRVDPANEKALRYINRTKEEISKLEGMTSL